MVNFFKKGFSIMTTGLRWIIGAALSASGFVAFFVGSRVGTPFNMVRKWAAKRSWTKPLNWLLAPVEFACDIVAFGGICVGFLGVAAFWPEVKGTKLGDWITDFIEEAKAAFREGVNSGLAGEQEVEA